MAIYVDAIWEHGKTAKMPYPRSCHMMADSRAELLAFAARLGLQARWLHKDHFDITAPKRVLAVRLGALEMPGGGAGEGVREKVAFLRRIREQWAAEKGDG
jgi:hypothetical protein